jgi:hypothetical protein
MQSTLQFFKFFAGLGQLLIRFSSFDINAQLGSSQVADLANFPKF